MSNRKFGKYEVVDRLGRGGMAEVYRAYHASLDRYVAIKVLHNFLAEDQEFKERFEKEAQNIARLKHPHIVQVYDFEHDDEKGEYYMVMELISGVTLKDRLFDLHQKGEKIALEESLRIVKESAKALAYAHKAGMIHRDVKPANLMLDEAENDRLVLTDFGIAKILTGAQFTMTGGLIGTPAYMAPEQGVGESGDERSDLYSLGVIFYQMVTGELPYDADTPLALILKHVNEAIPSACMVNPALPTAVDDVVERLMAKDVELRYQTANEVIRDVEQLESDLAAGILAVGSSLPPTIDDTLLARDNNVKLSDHPTVRLEGFNDSTMQLKESIAAKMHSKGDSSKKQQSGTPWLLWLLGLIIGIMIIIGGYVVGVNNGTFPAIAFLASETPSPEPTITETVIPTATLTLPATETESPSETPSLTPTETEEMLETATDSPSNTPESVMTDTEEPTRRPTNTVAVSPSLTPNVTLTETAVQATQFAQQTLTTVACEFDYAIAEQDPVNGNEGGFFEINTEYERTIILVNTGTCPWGPRTSLAFVEGEDFDAGPRVFFDDRETAVDVGEEVTLTFSGTLPSAGSSTPYEGTWQLRTPGQIPIGEALMISVRVFDPGS